MSLLRISVFAFAFLAFTEGAALPRRDDNNLAAPRALYYMTNINPNAIVAIPVARNGSLLTPFTSTLTGGSPGADTDAATGGPDSPDALASSGSVAVANQVLFAVNAGSNTLSMFSIDEHDPTKLTPIGQPRNTNGEFPVSVAASAENNLVCVANTGAKSGITCASYSPFSGLGVFDNLRDFKLNQTTPPIGLANTISQVFFSEDERVLYATVKGLTSSNPVGWLSAFSVNDGRVSYKEIRSSPANTKILFGVATIPGSSNILAADGSIGAEVISVNSRLQGSTHAQTAIPGNKLTCWAAFSTTTGTGFLTDGGANHITEVDINTGALVTQLLPGTPNFGMNDVAAVGNWIYALSPNTPGNPTAVTVFDVSGGRGSIKLQQVFYPGGMDNYAEGMVWIM